MAEHNLLGELGEQMAAEHLAENGYAILSRKWKFRRTDIDIIAEKDGLLIFVEVKTRSSEAFQTPADAVGMGKQKTLVNAADEYIKSNDRTNEGRFDVIFIIHNKKYTKINHIVDAFYPTL